MAASLHHRGPDEFGVYRDEALGLAHARLSIIDVASGQQPLTTVRETTYIAFNGEIFNYIELRAQLSSLGARFRTESDTEVIVAAYEQWGEDAFARFNGQFAIALWDTAKKKLLLARDWAGIRPLYLAEHDGRVYFASEVKAIFSANLELPRSLDPAGISQTFCFWSIVPPTSVFSGIRELEPGHLRIYEGGEVSDRAFFEHEFPIDPSMGFSGSVEDAADAVRETLKEATRLRMLRADVPVGSYLSGGLDSSLAASFGLEAKGASFQTFSLRFEDAEYDETGFQREMVSRLGTEHSEIVVSRDDIAEVFSDVIWFAERPLLRTAPAPLFLLSRLVREKGIKVVLTGEGADEVFAGYDLFREAKVRRFWARQPNSELRPQLLDRLYPYLARSPVKQRALSRRFFGRDLEKSLSPGFSHGMRWSGAKALQRMFTGDLKQSLRAFDPEAELLDRLPEKFSSWDVLAQDQYLEMRTLLAGYLLSSQGDRMLMGNSVEGRFPFLDVNVLRLAHSLPAHYKLRVLDEKHVLKRASEGLVPASILKRKKQPYRAPDALAFVGKSQGFIDELLAPAAVKDAGIFEPRAIEVLWTKCKKRAADGQFSNVDNMGLVGAISTQILHNQFIARAPDPRHTITLTTLIDRCA